MKVDYMRPGAKRIKIKDNTRTKEGRPTFESMMRQLIKAMR